MAEIKNTISFDFGNSADEAEELADELERVNDENEKLRQSNNKAQDSLKNYQAHIKELEKDLRDLSKTSLKEVTKSVNDLQKDVRSFVNEAQKNNTVIKNLSKGLTDLAKATGVAKANAAVMQKEFQAVVKTWEQMQGKLSAYQKNVIGKKQQQLFGELIDLPTFEKSVARLSKAYSTQLNKNLYSATLTKDEQKNIRDRRRYEDANNKKYSAQMAKAKAIEEESNIKKKQAVKIGAEKLAQEKATTEQKEQQLKYQRELGKENLRTARAKAGKAQSQETIQYAKETEYFKTLEAAETQREQKLEKNERARLALRKQMEAIAKGEYEMQDKTSQSLALAVKRLKDTSININNFAATKGYKGTVGLESTSQLRVQQFYKTIRDYAVEWKRANSEEGKAADTLGRVIETFKKVQSGINRVHTAFGQLSSTVSATRQIGIEFRNTFNSIAEPLLNIVKTVASQAFRSSLEALKNLELSEIGFSNFFGASQVPSIMQSVKKEALLSPLSAAQLAAYVNQIAPLSGGNSQLALNATMGVAKMIQYSGGEVSTEMEYVIRNLRDVIAKGKATTIDIRQFNRAMPALKKVLQEMGLEDFLKDGEIAISKETAPKLLEAFEKINDFEDVGEIFEHTSQTVSGLMERVEEQIQFLVIDVAEFSGLTKLIKDTLSDILEDSDGIINDIKAQAQFFGRDIISWLKSRDWERIKDTLKEVFDIFYKGLVEVMSILRKALGGTDWRETFVNLATTISNFVKGIAQSYSWLLGIMNSLNGSGILGSGVIQGGVKVLGFLSGNGGAAITGITRSFGNALGVLNQATFSVIKTMELHQQELVQASTTINTFDEALLIVSQSLNGVAKDILAVDAALGGILTEEQKEILTKEMETNQRRTSTAVEQSRTMAVKLDTEAAKQEAAARSGNTAAMQNQSASGMGLFAAPKSSVTGTKIGNALGNIIRTAVAGAIIATIGGWISSSLASAAGEDQYSANSIGGYVGGLAGGTFMGAKLGSLIAPGIGTAIGAALGAIGGGVYGVINANAQSEERRKNELDAFKATVNNGTYLRELLATMEHGSDLTNDQLDGLNAKLVKQMNQWAASTPAGTAQMLKDYLRNIEFNGRSIDETVRTMAQDDSVRADTLWGYIKDDDIEGGNAYAATLKNLGWSSYKISAAILDKALANGSDRDKAIDYLLKWGTTQIQEGEAGEDLTYEYVKSLSGRQLQSVRDALQASWTEIGKAGFQNLQMSEDEATNNRMKQEMAEGLGIAMSKLLTGAVDELTANDQLYLHRYFTSANVKNVAEQLGIIMDPGTINYGDGLGRYGITSANAGIWGNASKGHGAEGYGTSSFFIENETIDKMTEGMTSQEKWHWMEDYFEEYGLSTDETIQRWIEEDAAREEARKQEIQGIQEGINEANENLREITYLESTNSAAWLHDIVSNQKKINELNDRLKVLGGEANGGIVHMASGGQARGVDTIPAMLQRGEFVVRRSAVDKVGLTALNALNTGNLDYFAKMMGRQNIYGDYNGARTWNSTSNDNRKSTRNYINIVNNSKGARLNRYYGLANRIS